MSPDPDPGPGPGRVPKNAEKPETADDPAIPDLEPDPTDPALPDPDLPTDYDIDPENLRDLDDDRYSDAEAESPKQSAAVASEVTTTADPLRVPARGALAIVPDHRDLARPEGDPSYRFLTTGAPDEFEHIGRRFLVTELAAGPPLAAGCHCGTRGSGA